MNYNILVDSILFIGCIFYIIGCGVLREKKE